MVGEDVIDRVDLNSPTPFLSATITPRYVWRLLSSPPFVILHRELSREPELKEYMEVEFKHNSL